jgi:hypothetical protein
LSTRRAAVGLEVIRNSSVLVMWQQGFRGQGVRVGILDEGIDGSVVGGRAAPGSAVQIGGGGISSHGSMCAADVLVAAFGAFAPLSLLGIPNSAGP